MISPRKAMAMGKPAKKSGVKKNKAVRLGNGGSASSKKTKKK
jgi:hypothetical protein